MPVSMSISAGLPIAPTTGMYIPGVPGSPVPAQSSPSYSLTLLVPLWKTGEGPSMVIVAGGRPGMKVSKSTIACTTSTERSSAAPIAVICTRWLVSSRGVAASLTSLVRNAM